MTPLSQADIRKMCKRMAIKHGTYKQWAELHGIHVNQLSNFMTGACNAPPKVLAALGIVKVMVLAADLPEGFDPTAGNVSRRKPETGEAYAYEDPMS